MRRKHRLIRKDGLEMASAKFGKGSEEWMLFMDFWNYCQKYWIPEKEDEYWEELINAGDAFCKKYGNSIFSRKLIMAFIEKLEEESKRRMRTQ